MLHPSMSILSAAGITTPQEGANQIHY